MYNFHNNADKLLLNQKMKNEDPKHYLEVVLWEEMEKSPDLLGVIFGCLFSFIKAEAG